MAAGCGADGRLAALLSEVWASQMPVAEKRRLSFRLSLEVLRGQGTDQGRAGVEVEEASSLDEGTGTRSHLVHLEEALLTVGRHVGRDSGQKVTIAQAKAVLRPLGPEGMKLASRLGRLSKLRNAAAHPDVAFVADIKNLLSGTSIATTSSASSEPEKEAEVKKKLMQPAADRGGLEACASTGSQEARAAQVAWDVLTARISVKLANSLREVGTFFDDFGNCHVVPD